MRYDMNSYFAGSMRLPRKYSKQESKRAYVQRYVRDPEYWGAPYGTPITAGMITARASMRRVPNQPAIRRISPRDSFKPLKNEERTYATDDASQMKNLSPDLQKLLKDQLLEVYGADEEMLYENLKELFERAKTSGAVEVGIRWYEDGGNFAAAYALSYGLTREQGIATVAALSPLNDWENNIAQAQYVMDIVMEDPVIPDLQRPLTKSTKDASGKLVKQTKPAYEWLEPLFEKRKLGSLDDVVGKRLSELTLPQQAILIRHLSQAGYFTDTDEKLSYMGVNKQGKPIRKYVGWPASDEHTEKAIAILRADPEDVPNEINNRLGGMKVRSFFNNLAFGSTEPPAKRPDITMDSHAMFAALNKTYSGKLKDRLFGGPPSSAPYGFTGFYPIFADVYRRLAEENSLEPHHFQALIWLQWRHEQDGMPLIVHSALEGGN